MTLVSEHEGRIYLTSRAHVVRPGEQNGVDVAWDIAGQTNPGFLWVAGKFVEADQPNLNRQFWTSEDLEFGHFSVRYTPMNMLHKIYDPIGVYVESNLVPATDTANSHIAALGCVWAYRYPQEAAAIEKADQEGSLYYSMECVGERLHCKGGCEEEFDYFAPKEDLCSHLQERSSIRHIVNPYFTGGAIIIPPAKPAWPKAQVELLADQFARAMDDTPDHKSVPNKDHWSSIMSLVQSYATAKRQK